MSRVQLALKFGWTYETIDEMDFQDRRELMEILEAIHKASEYNATRK